MSRARCTTCLPVLCALFVAPLLGADNLPEPVRQALAVCAKFASKKVPEDHPGEGVDVVRFSVDDLKVDGLKVSGQGTYRSDRGFTPFRYTCVLAPEKNRTASFTYEPGPIELFPWVKDGTPDPKLNPTP